MSDPIPRPDDELVSAYLDGEATAEEQSQVESDPTLLARLESFHAVRAAVTTPVEPPPDEVRDAAVRAALTAAPAAATVTDITTARSTRSARSVRWTPVLSVAAAVLAVLAAIPILSRLGDDADQTAAGTGTTSAALEAGVAADSAGGSSDGALLIGVDLGSYTDQADLREAVSGRLSSAGTAAAAPADAAPATTVAAEPFATDDTDATAESGVTDRAGLDTELAVCDAAMRAQLPSLGELLLSGTATLADEPVLVLVYALVDAGDGPPHQLLALARSTCEIRNVQRF